MEAQGRAKEARDYYTKCVDITPEMAYQLIKVSYCPFVTVFLICPEQSLHLTEI